jgi:hypothetical protein
MKTDVLRRDAMNLSFGLGNARKNGKRALFHEGGKRALAD